LSSALALPVDAQCARTIGPVAASIHPAQSFYNDQQEGAVAK